MDPWDPQPTPTSVTSTKSPVAWKAQESSDLKSISSLLPPLPDRRQQPSVSLEHLGPRKVSSSNTKATGSSMIKEMEQIQPVPASDTRHNDSDVMPADDEGSNEDDDSVSSDSSYQHDTTKRRCFWRCLWLASCCMCCFRGNRTRPIFLGSNIRRLPKSMDNRPLLDSDDEDDEIVFSSSPPSIYASHGTNQNKGPPKGVFALSDSDSDTAFTVDAKPII
eukprot:gene9564-1791_t